MWNKPIPVANMDAVVQAEKLKQMSLLISCRSSSNSGNPSDVGAGGAEVRRNGHGHGHGHVVNQMVAVIESIGSYQGFRRTQRKECLKLLRRLNLLLPLLEEIRDFHTQTSMLPPQHLNCLDELQKALRSARKLLKQCHCGSKIYLALESEAVLSQFHAVYDQLNQALDDMPYQELGVSVEVTEQVELMRTQLKRAKRRTDTQDMELAMDMMVVFSKNEDRNADSAILQRLAINLELHTVADLKAETMAVEHLIAKRGGRNSDSNQKILDLLRKFKEIAGVEDDLLLSPASSRNLQRCQSSIIPNEFLCPITLEIMTDPVITATGQTYERESIYRWLDSNHRTCPKTGQTLDHTSLAPNVALKNLIRQWCEKNNYDLPKKTPYVGPNISSGKMQEEISSIVKTLSSSDRDKLREAVLKIRLLSRENPDNRILIANSGGLPPLVQLLRYPDPELQEQTVTALLNLSINETNKRLIAGKGAVPAIIEILQNGTEEARENSAAALFSLAMLDENKALVGNLNGIPPLVELLQNGTVRGKKDAATALFNLCLNQTNKPRAIEAGIIPRLLRMLEDKNLGMVDEALSILNLLASHPEGRNEIGRLSFIETLVGIIGSGTPKNKECATSVLLELGTNNSSFILAALQYGVYDHLVDLTINGTNRAQRKANSLLQLMSKCEHIP